jgi:hypothetical protein
MKHLVILLVALASGLYATDSRQSVAKTPDRTITWHSWQDQAEFRVRTGDRYLGRSRWEHYLVFQERPLDLQRNQDFDDSFGQGVGP